jgi:hypothetical protein
MVVIMPGMPLPRTYPKRADWGSPNDRPQISALPQSVEFCLNRLINISSALAKVSVVMTNMGAFSANRSNDAFNPILRRNFLGSE